MGRRILAIVRAPHDPSLQMDDDTAEAIARELGVRERE